ncbi:hypothetical protein J5N97_029636 [Dioscorea zingiberensis]|uniref:Protein kinase domain-containing protein n=1 Tax=Dioscorea zingiberensis TaxID=325984 RepID=A0A9D5BWB4_9LILI|nr:hypothetical protein J5N97_029636 [Dioscorea zingiberensis]
MEDRYEPLRCLGKGTFSVARLARDKRTNEFVAIKYIERGERIDEKVQREITNHSEDEARFFFQQLISGVSYCHSMEICHRDLKLENILLDGSPTPLLKICDFGYSKSGLWHSQPKSAIGTPSYIAPEILSRKEYDGKMADVWACGVTLYVMLIGSYPFADPDDPKDIRSAINRIKNVQYSFPDNVNVSPECKNLLSQIFIAEPSKRMTIADIKKHPWFLKTQPEEWMEVKKSNDENLDSHPCTQSLEEIQHIIEEAKIPAEGDLNVD